MMVAASQRMAWRNYVFNCQRAEQMTGVKLRSLLAGIRVLGTTAFLS